MSSAVALELRGLSRSVSTGKGTRAIVDDFTYSFQRGKIHCILGPSGAGKTSLLRLVNRLDEPGGGKVLFDGVDVETIPPCELRRRVGCLFQTPYLFEGTARDNIRYADAGLTDEELVSLANLAQITGELIDADGDNLSVGEKQRVALARLLATEPSVALLDEPTSALDPGHSEAIESLIRRMADEKGLTVIMVSHNPEQAIRMGGEALLMVDGKLVESGPCEEVVSRPRTALGRKYRDRELT